MVLNVSGSCVGSCAARERVRDIVPRQDDGSDAGPRVGSRRDPTLTPAPRPLLGRPCPNGDPAESCAANLCDMAIAWGQIDDAQDGVIAAVQELVRRDADLFERDVNERTLTQHLAIYLAKPNRFGQPEPFDENQPRGYHVDCEYNRNGQGAKDYGRDLPEALKPLLRRVANIDDANAATAFPDIIVHQRNTNERNFVMIEVKKATGTSNKLDQLKLNAFGRGRYRYAVRVLVLLETRRDWNADGSVRGVRGPGATLEFLGEPQGDTDVVCRTVHIASNGDIRP